MFLTGSNTELSGGLGLYSGYIYSQQTENTSIPKNYEPEPGLVYPYPRHRFNDVEIFNDYYFGFNAGIGVRQFLSPKASLQIRPNYLFQIRQKLQADPYYWSERLMSFSLDIGFYYRLGANVE